MHSTELRVQKVKKLLEGASIQEPAYDPVCSECARILQPILFDEDRLFILMKDLKNWKEDTLYDLFVVIFEHEIWSEEQMDAVPLRLFLHLFLSVDVENYDVMLDAFSAYNKNEKVERSILLEVQGRLLYIREHYALDEYLEGWWKYAARRTERLLNNT